MGSKAGSKGLRRRIVIGADHNGFRTKARLVQMLRRQGYTVRDVGAAALRPRDDYPVFAGRVARAVLADAAATGILVCGSGNGMVMAANRFRGIRAALVTSADAARKAREDEDANVLVLPAWWVPMRTAERIITVWLATPFSGASRHRRRIRLLDRLGHG